MYRDQDVLAFQTGPLFTTVQAAAAASTSSVSLFVFLALVALVTPTDATAFANSGQVPAVSTFIRALRCNDKGKTAHVCQLYQPADISLNYCPPNSI